MKKSKARRNYQRGNVINYMDGDSASMVYYGYGKTTLISDKSRVYKGGSWNDRPYWLSPGTRRALEEDQASATVGFRCAMDRVGSQEGNGFKNGQYFGKRRQNFTQELITITLNIVMKAAPMSCFLFFVNRLFLTAD
jgi:hypothetical protein